MLEVNPSKSGKSLVFSEKTYDHGIETSRKLAALSLDPSFATLDPEEQQEKIAETIAWVQTQNWELFGKPDQNGFCNIRRVVAETETEEQE